VDEATQTAYDCLTVSIIFALGFRETALRGVDGRGELPLLSQAPRYLP
jgi:hypothetical protein